MTAEFEKGSGKTLFKGNDGHWLRKISVFLETVQVFLRVSSQPLQKFDIWLRVTKLTFQQKKGKIIVVIIAMCIE